MIQFMCRGREAGEIVVEWLGCDRRLLWLLLLLMASSSSEEAWGPSPDVEPCGNGDHVAQSRKPEQDFYNGKKKHVAMRFEPRICLLSKIPKISSVYPPTASATFFLRNEVILSWILLATSDSILEAIFFLALLAESRASGQQFRKNSVRIDASSISVLAFLSKTVVGNRFVPLLTTVH